jgi:hypothetical protein
VTTLARLSAFAVVLAALFGAGAAAGDLIDPAAPAAQQRAGKEDGMDGGHEGAAVKAAAVRGLSVAADGRRLVVDDRSFTRGRRRPLRFRIVDRAGEPVRAFDVEHTKRMHVIVARRDLTTFQHLHPRQRPDGTWETPLRLDEPGSYRLFADFSHGGRASTLASDLHVDGPAESRALPAPAGRADAGDGYAVRLDAGAPRAGREAHLRFTITRDGRPVTAQPYLGARGHLVALRDGDLAFLHVHPEDDAVAFEATFPTTGRYRLFLQFRHGGAVRTAAFTQEVAQP